MAHEVVRTFPGKLDKVTHLWAGRELSHSQTAARTLLRATCAQGNSQEGPWHSRDNGQSLTVTSGLSLTPHYGML